MMTKRRIALLIAGMLVGAQVGIASMSGPGESSEQQPETPLQAEATEPTTSAEQTESQATAEQASAPEQQADAAPAAPAKPRTLADATFPPLHSDTFPPSADERPLNPYVAAYLEARAANTLLADAGARSSPFPDAEEPGQRMLPTQIAYFERLEAERLAAYEQRLMDHAKVVRAELTTAVPLTSDRVTALQQGLANLTGRQVQLQTKVDPGIIAGAVARIGSTVYDGSVTTQLQKVKERLVNAAE